jgi:hypothetical protein
MARNRSEPRTVHNGGYRVSHDRGAVTVGNEAWCGPRLRPRLAAGQDEL